MIAFVLRELGLDPAWLIGAEVPQLGSNAGVGDGWLVVEGDESDRTIESLRPEIAVITNVDLDHHATFASLGEVRGACSSGSRRRRRWSCAAPSSSRTGASSRFPASTTAATRRRRSRRSRRPASRGPTRSAALASFRGAGRRFELRGEAGGVAVYDDYAHNPAKVAAVLAAAREARPDGRVLVLFQPHLYSRTRHSAHELGAALAAADAVAVTEVYPAREQPVDGVTREARRRRARRGAARRCRSPGRRGSRTASASSRSARGRATSCSRSAPATSTVRPRCSWRRSS